MIRRRAVLLAVGVALGCATPTSRERPRELPVGLAPAGALLTGCTATDDGGLVRARCDDEVTLSMLTRRAGAEEPRYREEAFALGGAAGARIAWDRVVVPTEGPSGAVDRARVLAPLATEPVATLIGAVRDVGGREVQEVWCSSHSDDGDRRCRELVGAVLGTIPGEPARDAAPGQAARAGAAPPVRMSGPPNVFGRALSLPTSCRGTLRPDGGDASCDDGASLSWRRLATMDEASAALVGTLAALDLTEGVPFPCTVAGEPGQCEDHGGAIAGLAYLDGAPVAVACFTRGARAHALCGAIVRAR
ncbi:MAG: hypothetical protein A2138_21740 [Deltaproteobacteria bacterium RBG_16_71_12]|nr:MAG: hypothetical protein A2138_21740 [Deltaproteobacteria bacterium RBG_16_71_12]